DTLENKWNFESDTVNDDISLYAKWVDDIAPDVKLSIETNEWKTFLNNMTFNLFFKETKSVIINASDEGSGVKSVQYLLSDQAFSSEGDIIGAWQSLTLNDGEVSFDINPNNKYFIYAKVVDNDNNETVVNSDGIVLYTKSILKSEVAEFNFDKQEDILVEIELNGNTLKSISNSTTLLTENTDYTINDNVVTINKNYIANVLNGDEIELTFLYNPMGVEKDEVSVITTLKIAKHKHNIVADDGDCSTAIVCNECDVIMVDAKEHSWESNWQIDDNKHWHKCTNGGCLKSNEDGVHEWDDGEVTTPATVDNEGVKTYTCSLCEHTKTEVIPKIIPNETLVDTSSGIKVTYEDEREFESSIILTIKSEPQEKMNEFNDEVNKVASGYSLCGLYDVKLLKDGIEIQPDGKIKISIPLVNIIKPMTDLQVVYIDDEGKVTIIPSEVKDGYLVFITDHLSYYGIIGKVNITIDNGGSTPSDKVDSGDNQLIQNYFMILIMSIGMIMMLKQHQRELVEVESTRRIKGFKNKVKFTKFVIREIIKEVKNRTYFKDF
ncbi:MAG: X2-like carbohydrate binding domain-containing protein, partial [Coprobacillus sp.]